MNEDLIEALALEPVEAAFEAAAGVIGGVDVGALSGGGIKFLTDLGADDPVRARFREKLAEAFLTGAVGGGGIEVIDTQVAGGCEEGADLVVAGQIEGRGIFHPGVAPDFHRAQADDRHGQASRAERSSRDLRGISHERGG